MPKLPKRARLRLEVDPLFLADIKLCQERTGIRGKADLLRHAVRMLLASSGTVITNRGAEP